MCLGGLPVKPVGGLADSVELFFEFGFLDFVIIVPFVGITFLFQILFQIVESRLHSACLIVGFFNFFGYSFEFFAGGRSRFGKFTNEFYQVGALNLAVNTSSGGTVTADVNVTGGNVTLGPVNMANAGTGRTVTATIDLTGGTVEVVGDIVRTGGAGTENATLTLDGAILDMNSNSIGSAGSTVTFNAQAGTLQNLGELNGGGTLTKSTAGTLILDTANGYTGGTTVTSGTLLANNATGSATGSGMVTVNSGTLGGSGSVAGATTINSGATLTAGTVGGVDSLAFGGNLSVAAGSTWLVDFVSGLADFVDVQSGVLSLGGAINIVDDGSWVPYQSYQIASYSSLTGSFSNALTSGIQVGNFFIDYGSGTSDFITLTAVPEPETWVPALLVLILGLGLHRRRRR